MFIFKCSAVNIFTSVPGMMSCLKYFRSKKIQKWHCFMSVARNVFVKKVEN